MRRRRVSFSYDPRKSALKRAGLAVTMGLVLLAIVLWFEEGNQPSRPLSESANVSTAQLSASAPEADAAQQAVNEPSASETGENTAPSEATESAPHAPAPPAPPRQADASMEPLPNGYFVQLGVFNTTDSASRLFDNATALGLPTHIQSRVVVGPFSHKREAEAARDRLKDVAKGVVLPPQKIAKAPEKTKAKPKSRQRTK